MWTRTIRWVGLCALIAAMVSCDDDGGIGNDGALVGGSCGEAADCDDRCERNGDFPEGICTTSCREDDDCPEGTACIDKEDGICLVTCERPSDCRGGYTCKGEDNRGHGGESLVCIGD